MHGRCKEGARDRDGTADGQGRTFGETKPMLCRYTGKFRATSAKHTHVNGEKGEGTVADYTPKENIAAKH